MTIEVTNGVDKPDGASFELIVGALNRDNVYSGILLFGADVDIQLVDGMKTYGDPATLFGEDKADNITAPQLGKLTVGERLWISKGPEEKPNMPFGILRSIILTDT